MPVKLASRYDTCDALNAPYCVNSYTSCVQVSVTPHNKVIIRVCEAEGITPVEVSIDFHAHSPNAVFLRFYSSFKSHRTMQTRTKQMCVTCGKWPGSSTPW